MECCQAQGIEEYMDLTMARKELEHYRKKGPAKTTTRLLEFLIAKGVDGLTLLDIGGGVGAIQHELLKSGVREASSVDASSGYLKAAKTEAECQGTQSLLHQHHGDFVELAEDIREADIVTLDRVICCYDDMEKLVRLSAERASKFYGVVYPPDHALMKFLTWLENLYHKARRSQFRAFAHANSAIDQVIQRAGLERAFSFTNLLWRVEVYRRPNP